MERLTTRNSEGVPVYKSGYECERCGEIIWRLPDLGRGSPTTRLCEYGEAASSSDSETESTMKQCKALPKEDFLRLLDECVSGKIVLPEDIEHILEVYGDTYVQPEGSIGWKLRSEVVGQNLSKREALQYAEDGCFVASQIFSSDQSLHWWNGKFYYEDGAVVTEEFLDSQDWADVLPWRVVAFNDEVDIALLNRIHERNNGYMLTDGSYMAAIKNRK